ncbi:MAG: hypothetical protein M1823_000759 [Watsoniomyces obsoletus]|nr:MAG: hypothetical protein M1823_000759 [Watsoniomyces obsoletus]
MAVGTAYASKLLAPKIDASLEKLHKKRLARKAQRKAEKLWRKQEREANKAKTTKEP